MSLVAYPDIASLPEEVRTAIAHAPVQLNIFKMMANAETCFIPLTRLGGTILSPQKLDAKLRELVILMVAKIEGGEYEWIQHVPIAISVGAMQEQVDAIARNAIDAPCFSDVERAALRFTEEVVNRVKADEATVRELMKFLSPREIVELILAIGFYMTMARLTETTRTDLDPPAGTKVVDALRC
ncbi:MAG TPA: carboxymuconolactone decarboxylase family protein [Candidatus Binatus sp.]|uniref:carboxymuconolactone decarboxylase family protein n=1 Tax=Candidatus Binatus sp. TaxID=2811406 RepID=UPI002B4A5489|nr:carboxymuconolactone decarboxylase family protein [Candidatus Binatus sp.]HKN14537.1 carboxymuconolactone decarboxylase family protein [Candidatus Binatus sp.]